jgi:hypothetical protein
VFETEIDELDSDVQALGERIDEIETTVDEKEAARKKEHEEYEEEADDIKDAIKAIDRAMDKLTGAKDDMKGDVDKDFVQVLANTAMFSRQGSKTPETVQKVIALLQGDKPGEAHAYNYKSNDVIDILRNLRRDFKTELKDVDEEEHDKKASHEKKMLALNNEKKFKDKEKTEKKDLSEVRKKIEEEFTTDLKKAFATRDKKDRSNQISEITDKAKKLYEENENYSDLDVNSQLKDLEKSIVRTDILKNKNRIDGRGLWDVRQSDFLHSFTSCSIISITDKAKKLYEENENFSRSLS